MRHWRVSGLPLTRRFGSGFNCQPMSMRAGPTGVRYRRPGPTAYRRLLNQKFIVLSDTLPKSKKPTPPSFPVSGMRTSDDPSNIERPPIGRPKPLSGLTS